MLQKLALNMGSVVIGRVVSVAVGFLSIALLTRHLGPEGYGEYRIVLTLTGIGAIFADLGLQLVILREIADPERHDGRILGAGLTLRLVTTALVMLIVALATRFLPYAEPVLLGVLVAAPYYVLYQCCQMLQGVFEKHLRQGRQMLAETAGGLTMLACVWLAMLLDAGVVAMVAGLLAGGVVQFALVWLFAARLEPMRPIIDLDRWRRLLRAGLPIAGSKIALMAILRGDILILSVLGTATAVGLYGVPSKMFEILSHLASMFGGMLMPMLLAALASGDPRATGRTVAGALDAMLVFGAGVVICFAAFGAELLDLVAGDAFVEAHLALVLIGVAIAANAAAQIFRFLLLAMDRQRQIMRIDLIAFGIALVAYLILVPLFSYPGAALATALVETALAGLLAWRAFSSGRLARARPRILRILLCAGLTFLAMRFAADQGWHWFLAMSAGGLLYGTALLAAGAVPLALLRGRKGPPATDESGTEPG